MIIKIKNTDLRCGFVIQRRKRAGRDAQFAEKSTRNSQKYKGFSTSRALFIII